MKKLLLIILMAVNYSAYCQIYAPEIKVKEMNNNGVGIGIDNIDINAKLHIKGDKAEIVKIESSAPSTQVSIENTSPGGSQWRLISTGNGTSMGGGKFSIYDHAQAKHRLIIDNSGKIGINTASPGADLHINGDTFVKDLRIVENVDVNIETSWIYSKYGVDRQLGLLLTDDGKTKAEIKLWEGNIHNPYISFSTSPNTGNAIEQMRINKYGNVGIGTSSPSQKLHVIGNVLANNVQVTSDRKLKKNIKDYNKGLAMVKNIHTVEYQMIAETDSVYVPSKLGKKEKKAPTYVGVIAQELQQIAPDLVHTYLDDAGEETLAIDYTALTFILINAVKEQQVLIEELQKKVLKK